MNRDVQVTEVMDREYVGVSESDTVRETAELLLREGADTAIVLRGAEPVGVLTERDVVALVVEGEDPAGTPVEAAMRESVPTVDPKTTLAGARDRMASWDTSWLVVSNGGEPIGVVTEHDILTSSTLGTEAAAAEGRPTTGPTATGEALVDAGANAAAVENGGVEADEFEDQGICEKCESLSRDLTAFNGQLLCADCRDI